MSAMDGPDSIPGSGDGTGEPRAARVPVVTVRCREDGPLVVELSPAPDGTAILRVTDHQGRPFPLPADKPLVALCRCGHSKNRPFCDGSHRATGFSAAELAPGTTASR